MVWLNRAGQEAPPASPLNSELPLSGTSMDEPTITIIDPIRGNPEAPVTIIEFADYLCEFCKETSGTLKEILAAYPNQVRLVWKDFPNDALHANATQAAIAARCAGEQGKYWEYHDLLMAQSQFTLLPLFVNLAITLDLDRNAFAECLNTETPLPRVQKTIAEAQALGLDGVPFFFINNQPFTGTTFEDFEHAIKAAQ